ncbi:MAG TPA: amine dehydrogenase large subunit [Candidatus Binataceae bacterium]|jgi:methylamine dehydrogenase heavy chain|nr:amine dehydrogenase large subunit [Candidatus Binataceae bacterium]
MAKRLGLLIAAVLASTMVRVGPGALAQMPPNEQVTVLQLPAASPHWVATMTPLGGSIMMTPVVLIDGDTLQVLGNLSGGLAAMFAASPDHKYFYLADTFYSRGTQGDRTDVLTIYDATHLSRVGEIPISSKRQLALADPSSMGVTPDGRFVLMLNLTPATSVTAVDLENKKVAGEIQTPGCSEILILGDREFASVCADGSMLTTEFDDNATATAQKRTAKPFFDVEKDPVFQLPAMIDKKAYFVSYHGVVYPMDLGSSPAVPVDTWSLLSDQEKKDGWRPGGWQPVAGYAPGHLIFVLMHQGGEWTQKVGGPEVWVYDVNEHKRVAKIPMPLVSNAIRVSQDDNPLLFALVTSDSKLQVFSALKGRYLGTVNEVSSHPYTMFGL